MRTSKIGAAHAGPRRTRSRTRIAAGALTVVSVAAVTTGALVNSATGAPAFVPDPPVAAEKVQTGDLNLNGNYQLVPNLSLNLTKRGLYLVTANLRGKITTAQNDVHGCFIRGVLYVGNSLLADSQRLVVTNIGSSPSAVDTQGTAPISMLVNVPKGGTTVEARAAAQTTAANGCAGAEQIINDDNGRSTLNAVRISK